MWGEGLVGVQDRLDRFQSPREPAGVLAQPIKQRIVGVAKPEAAIIVEVAEHGLGVGRA